MNCNILRVIPQLIGLQRLHCTRAYVGDKPFYIVWAVSLMDFIVLKRYCLHYVSYESVVAFLQFNCNIGFA